MPAHILTHLVPGLWPQADAVGEYALELAVQLRRRHGIESRFVVCDPERDGPSRVEGFVVRRLRVRTEAGIWSLLAGPKEPDSAVLLHYTQYGYHRHGVPLWLYRGIRSWQTEAARSGRAPKQLCTIFHDSNLPRLPVWRPQFLAHLMQRWLIEALHRRSSISIVCTRLMQALVGRVEPGKTLWLPRPGNLPSYARPRFDRRRNGRLRFVITGSPRNRIATIHAHANLLRTFDRKDLLNSVILLGEGLDSSGPATEDVDLLQRRIQGNRIEIVGASSPQMLAGALGRADMLLSHHAGATACNSSSFMVALCTGCPPVLPDGTDAAPLTENEHFITSDDTRPSVERLEQMVSDGKLDRIAQAGQLWYDRHADWPVVAQSYHTALFRPQAEREGAGVSNPTAGASSALPSMPAREFYRSPAEAFGRGQPARL